VSFGNDNTDANNFTSRLSSDVFSMLDDKKPYIGEGFLPASIQFMSQVGAGKNIGATPDGREKGAPLCDSLGAIFGKDTEGPTALLKSVTSLDLKRALGIPVLNFNINPDFDDATLKALISGYMKLGGIQMQITCTSAQTLMEAYENPDLHKNLVVRVGGYSEYFQKLSDDLKKMVINRTIQKMV
jgi:formate C-acetyltransferase